MKKNIDCSKRLKYTYLLEIQGKFQSKASKSTLNKFFTFINFIIAQI